MLEFMEDSNLEQIYNEWSSLKWVSSKKKIQVDILILLVSGFYFKQKTQIIIIRSTTQH